MSQKLPTIPLLLMLCCGAVSAQKLPFGVYSIEDGLADSVVFTLLQDSEGYLWIGTRAGLSRFDGLEFDTFTTSEGLAHNVIRSLHQARDGSLLVATERGLSRIEGDRVSTLTTDDGLPHHSVRCLAEDRDGAVWLGTYGGGLARLSQGEISVFTSRDGLPNDKIRVLLLARNGDLWVGTYGGGLSRLRQEVFVTYGTAQGLANAEVRCLWEDDSGALWVGTKKGVYRENGDRFEPLFPGHEIAEQTINTIARDGKGRIWIGTREGGAFVLEKDGRLGRYTTAEGLSDNSIVTIMEDSEGSLWFGTYGGGLSRLSTESIRNYEAQEGFTYGNVYAIVEDTEGALWFGTNGGGLSRLVDGSFTSFTTDDGLAHNKVVSGLCDREGRLWFGTLDGVSRFVDGGFVTLTTDDGLASNVVYHIEEDRDGGIWFATFEGLTRLLDGEFQSFTRADGLADDRINFIHSSSDGSLWLGTANGLSHLESGVFTSLGVDDGLVSEFVNHITEDGDGALWISTNGGLSRYQKGQLTSFTTVDGLSHNSCAVALVGEDGALWVGTNRGVSRYDGTSFSVVTSKEGLIADLVNRGGGYKDRAGNLWFGTVGGVSQIQSGFTVPSLNPPPVQLVQVRVFDEPVPLNESLTLSHEMNYLKFEFEGISFRRSNDVLYRYQLEGLDQEWQVSRQRSVQYTSLEPGRYNFLVTAGNSLSGWNPTPRSFPFEIVPPFWQRPWFISVVVLILAGIVLHRVRALRRRTLLLETRVRERTSEVEKANEELRWLALNDRLTNLRNRHYVYEIMPEEISRLDRRSHRRSRDLPEQTHLGLALLDLDNFKRINDKFYHAAGDRALAQVAEILRQVTRDTDVVARWGGEEFLILFRDLDEASLAETVERILEAFRKTSVWVSETLSITLTCSIGYTHFPTLGGASCYSWEDIVRVADVALYTAKDEGRDRAVGFTYARDVAPKTLLAAIHNKVEDAIEQGFLVRISREKRE